MEVADIATNAAISEVILNGYYIRDRKGAVSVAREMFPEAVVRWVYYPEFRRMGLDLRTWLELSDGQKEFLAVQLEDRLTRLG